MNPLACQGETAGSGFKYAAKYNTIVPESCPHFRKCSAPICPLDPDWRSRTHLRGESICFFLRQYSKPISRAKFGGYIPEQLLNVIARVLPDIIDRYGDIRRRLKRSATTPSKLGRRPVKQMNVAA